MPLFRPGSIQELSPATIASYLNNITEEVQSADFNDAEYKQMVAMMFSKYLEPTTRPFFLHHFCPLINLAVRKMFENTSTPRILELGCGSGTMSILFALLGAKVTALDFDAASVSTCKKRQELYEKQFAPLQLEFLCGDALQVDYAALGQFDGIYSLFAFNMMQPTRGLLDRVLPCQKRGGTFMISDGNQLQVYNRYFRKRNCLSPLQMRNELSKRGYQVEALNFDCALPPAAFSSATLSGLSERFERVVLRRPVNKWIASSYTLVAHKRNS